MLEIASHKKKSICKLWEAKGLASHLHTIEIGSLGHWLLTSQCALLKAVPSLKKQTARKTMDEAACIVIAGA